MKLLQIDNLLGSAAKTVVPDSVAGNTQAKLRDLETLSSSDLVNKLISNMVDFAIDLGIAILVFYAGRFVINKLFNLVAGILLRRNVDRSLSTFVLSLIKMVLYFILVVTVIGILGIETSSFIAIFASAGVAIGMALSGTLQNFAGGVLILLLKPYKVGDFIEANGYAGTVTEIQIFHTIICTPDNKSIIIPNGGLSTGSINNWSREEYRRVDWSVGISYGDPVESARQAILAIIDNDPRIVKHFIEDDREERLEKEAVEAQQQARQERAAKKSMLGRLFHRSHNTAAQHFENARTQADLQLQNLKPRIDCSPVVKVNELGDSSVNLVVRAWTRSGDYWGVYFDILEKIYTDLPKAGVSFPFPQMDVHIDQVNNP